MRNDFENEVLFDDLAIIKSLQGANPWGNGLVMNNNDCTNNINDCTNNVYPITENETSNTAPGTRTAA